MPAAKLNPLVRGLLASARREPVAEPAGFIGAGSSGFAGPADPGAPAEPWASAETVILPAAPTKRAKLWELADKLHCPVIGTCIPLDELLRFAARFRFTASLRDAFALHVEMVGHARSRNDISQVLQRHLERKYRIQVERFARLKSDPELRREWKASLERGEIAGPLWATLTHKAASAETRQIVYGDIHMLSHQVGAGLAADTRRLAQLEKENAALRRDLREQAEESRRLADQLQAEKEVRRARDEAGEAAKAECHALRQRLAAFESGQVIVELGRKLVELRGANEQLLAVAQCAGEQEKTLEASRRECIRLTAERDRALDERSAIERLLAAAVQSESAGALLEGSGESPCETPASNSAGKDCEHCPRASNCILYVGGRASAIAQYRQLADRLGIRLLHHDGGLEESLSRLPELIRGADAVVCPTDNVSHSAYFQVKNHCKRVGKPCLFYTGSGVSSFAVAMTRVQRGEFSLGG